jgi:hypothetical protein
MRKMQKNLNLDTETKKQSFFNKTAIDSHKFPAIKDLSDKKALDPVKPKINTLNEKEIQNKFKEYRFKLNNELLAILSEERQKEEERERIISSITNKTEREKLEYNYGLERAQASNRIVLMNV